MTTLNSQLDNAAVMLDACRSELTRLGKTKEARQLRGLEVTSPTAARVALMAVFNLPKDEETAEVRIATVQTLQAAAVPMRQAS
jgi:hypothetical protein